jgi:hypothetical protein
MVSILSQMNPDYIVTCRGLRVTYKTGSGLDDWIYRTALTNYTVHSYTSAMILSLH